MCVWWLLYVIICFIAYFLWLFLCSPSHTSEKPPLPNSFTFSKPSGKRSPNVYTSSLLSSKGFFFFFSHFISILSRD